MPVALDEWKANVAEIEESSELRIPEEFGEFALTSFGVEVSAFDWKFYFTFFYYTKKSVKKIGWLPYTLTTDNS